MFNVTQLINIEDKVKLVLAFNQIKIFDFFTFSVDDRYVGQVCTIFCQMIIIFIITIMIVIILIIIIAIIIIMSKNQVELKLEKDILETRMKLKVLSPCATDLVNEYILMSGSLDIKRTVDF